MVNLKELDSKIDENYKFRSYLKCHADEKQLDEDFKKLHEKYFKIYDCSKCRNCCKKIGISMDESELDKICETYNYDKEKLKEKYLQEEYGEYTANPCPFLDDKTCKIEKCLPKSCQEYPYTNKEERLYSLITVVNNSKVCPVVYEILEELKDKYHFRR